MDCEIEKPPTSINPPADNSFSQVIFTNVQKFYPPKTDLHCKFHIEGNFNSSPKDWIGIFKVGWKTTRDYYTWISARTSVDNTVLFTVYYLPSDDDYYQFCYVDLNGEVRGASIPFQFTYNPESEDEDILMVAPEREVEKLTEEKSVLQGQVSSLEAENQTQAGKIQNLQDDLLSATEKIQRLEKENMELTIHAKNHEDELETMNKTIQSLNIDLQMQRNQEQKLLSEMKEIEKLLDNFKEVNKNSETLQIHIQETEKGKLKLESELTLYKGKEQKLIAEREELKQALEKSAAEKHHLQSEDMAKQKLVEDVTCTLTQCREENVKLTAELELQTSMLEKEKSANENLKQSLHKEFNKVLSVERMLKQKNEELRSAEETMATLIKEVDVLEGDNKNKSIQIETFHKTIGNLEGEVKQMKDAAKMAAEKAEKDLREQLASSEDRMLGLELQLAEQQDASRQQGEELVVLRSTLDVRNMEVENLKETHRTAAEKAEKDLREQLVSSEDRMLGLELQLAEQQDASRQQGEELVVLRSTLDVRNMEVENLKETHRSDRNTIDELHSHLLGRAPSSFMTQQQGLAFGNPYEVHGASSGSGGQSISFSCPLCDQTFSSEQILNDHVECHFN